MIFKRIKKPGKKKKGYFFSIVSTVITTLAIIIKTIFFPDTSEESSGATFYLIAVILLAMQADNLSHRKSEDSGINDIFSSIKNIENSIDGKLVHYYSAKEAHEYFETKIKNSGQIFHASVGPFYQKERPDYKGAFDEALRRAILNGSAYRYVTVVSNDAKQKRIDALLELGGNGRSGSVGIGTYPANREKSPPTIYFMIADNELLIRCSNDLGEKDEYYVTTDSSLITIFKKYHELLWRNSEKEKRPLKQNISK